MRIDEKIQPVVDVFIERAEQAGVLAGAALQEAEGPFDLIFNDIDKQGYPDSLPVMAAKLRPGGAILIDNMLWSGRILDPADRSPATEGVREFTRRIGSDPGWEVTLIPIRDGLILARKV